VDTIHGFVNRYLAIPWLVSHGRSVGVIDDDATAAVRRRNLGSDLYGVQQFLTKKNRTIEGLRLDSHDLDRPLGENFPAGPQSHTHKALTAAMKATAKQGYFCFDEMFHFATALLDAHPEVASILSQRFPYVLVDEMQDTSNAQDFCLSTVLSRSDESICVQRVGDENQAIYDSGDPPSQPFPDPTRVVRLADSYRFDQSVADLASNLAVNAADAPPLTGLRPTDASGPQSHTLFIFPNDDTSQVLAAFAEHVRSSLPPSLLERLPVAAVGEVHAPDENVLPGHAKYPKSVSDYWSEYRFGASRPSYEPRLVVDRVRSARLTVLAGGPIGSAVDLVAAGIVRLTNAVAGRTVIPLGSRTHRRIERLLMDRPEVLKVYRSFLARFVVGDEPITEAVWDSVRSDIVLVAKELAGPTKESGYDLSSLDWAEQLAGANGPSAPAAENVYVPEGGAGPPIAVRVGSIHAVKGQTHAATLILETYYYTHAIKNVLPWLLGEKSGGTGETERQLKRLRVTYVAMTRPTHLLCFALPQSSLGAEDGRAAIRAKLEARGWTLQDLELDTEPPSSALC
jgi:hypothetical protein